MVKTRIFTSQSWTLLGYHDFGELDWILVFTPDKPLRTGIFVWPGRCRVALDRPGSQRVVWSDNTALFQIASACPHAADEDRPRSALRRCLVKQIRTGTVRSPVAVVSSCARKVAKLAYLLDTCAPLD